jgi:hypothetical protein
VTGEYVGKPAGGKLLRMSLLWEDGLVRGLSIRGDFFAHPEEGFDEVEKAMIGTSVNELGESFARETDARGVKLYGLTPQDVGDAIASILSKAKTEGSQG